MPSRDEAQAAIKETNGTDLKGTAIRVNEAHPRRGGGSGDRRGGGRGSRRSY